MNQTTLILLCVGLFFMGTSAGYSLKQAPTEYVEVPTIEYVTLQPIWNVTTWEGKTMSLEIPELVAPIMVYSIAEDWADEILESIGDAEVHRYPAELVSGWHDPPEGVKTIIVIDTQEKALAIALEVDTNDATWYCIHDATTVTKMDN